MKQVWATGNLGKKFFFRDAKSQNTYRIRAKLWSNMANSNLVLYAKRRPINSFTEQILTEHLLCTGTVVLDPGAGFTDQTMSLRSCEICILEALLLEADLNLNAGSPTFWPWDLVRVASCLHISVSFSPQQGKLSKLVV